MDKMLENMNEFEPVAKAGMIGGLLEAVLALLSILISNLDTQLIQGVDNTQLVGGLMTVIVAIVSILQMRFERQRVTPVATPRTTNKNGEAIPLFPKEVKRMGDKAQEMRNEIQKMGYEVREMRNEAQKTDNKVLEEDAIVMEREMAAMAREITAMEREVQVMEEEAMEKGTREPVMLINSFIMVIKMVIPFAMALGLLSQEDADSLTKLTESLMALVMAVGEFAAVLMIRDQVTPIADPRDMRGEPLTP